MNGVIRGEMAALGVLFERHKQPLFNYLFRFLRDHALAEDVLVDAFLRVHDRRKTFKIGARFTTWLYTIAANLARNHHRWRTRHPNISLDVESEATGQSIGEALPAADPAPDSAAVATERAAAVRAEVERLPADMRDVIILCEWQDLSAAEAATILDTTPKAIDNRLYRARNLLRERLTKWV